MKSLKSFTKAKWEQIVYEKSATLDFEQVQRSIKQFGSLDPVPSLPTCSKLDQEKTYKLYIGGKQQRPDTQSSRVVYNFERNEQYCLVADASRKDVRNAVETGVSAFNRFSIFSYALELSKL